MGRWGKKEGRKSLRGGDTYLSWRASFRWVPLNFWSIQSRNVTGNNRSKCISSSSSSNTHGSFLPLPLCSFNSYSDVTLGGTTRRVADTARGANGRRRHASQTGEGARCLTPMQKNENKVGEQRGISYLHKSTRSSGAFSRKVRPF